MELLFSKRDLALPGAKEAFQRICAEPATLTRLGRLLLDTALTLDTKTVQTWHTEALDRFTPLMPSRVVNNLACCAVGLQVTEAALARLGLTWDQVFPITRDFCENWLQIGTFDYLLEGRVSNKTVVEQSLEIMDRMGLAEDECRFLDDGKLVALHVKGFYDRFTRYIRENAITTEHLQYNQFMKQDRKSVV